MRVFFAGAVTSGRPQVAQLAEAVRAVRAAGHEAMNAHVASEDIEVVQAGMTAAEKWDAARACLRIADAVIAEVSAPSTGLGYEIALALEVLQVPVLCLHCSGQTISPVFSGDMQRNLVVASWLSIQDIEPACVSFLQGIDVGR